VVAGAVVVGDAVADVDAAVAVAADDGGCAFSFVHSNHSNVATMSHAKIRIVRN
jgi:hypothetical protein